MEREQVNRRMAAILAADVAGYSRLMGADEEGTLARLKAHRRELLDPKVAEHHGRIVKTTGDGVLVEFGSVVDAMRCAIDLQRGMAERNAGEPEASRIDFRIGINLGDIIIDSDDIHGDGVNIAARLEALAEPGGICISQTVLDHARGKFAFDVEDGGAQTLKNIAQPVHIYRVLCGGTRRLTTPQASASALALPDKPSIAVLPFDDLSGERDQEYFADGMVEEIITALSRFRGLFVIARNSSFAYKGRAVNVKEVGRELGVRYILEGSVRKAGNRLRISGQLIDATTSMHLWAERFDGDLADIFDLQDQVTTSVVGAIAPKLEQAEIERTKHRPTDSLDAYDCYLRGLAGLHRFTKEDNSEALSHFRRAVELDPNFAAAYGMAARCYAQRKAGRWMADLDLDIAEAARLARRAVELGQDDAVALCTAGYALADVVNELEDGDNLIDRALTLNPNLAMAWIFSGWVKISLGSPELAIERLTHAMRLSPQDSYYFGARAAMASAHLAAGRYDEALSWAETALRAKPGFLFALCIAAASAALAGRGEAMRKAMMLVRQNDPQLRLSNLKEVIWGLQPAEFARWQDGLRLAGLPE